jgi:hypothetical protein
VVVRAVQADVYRSRYGHFEGVFAAGTRLVAVIMPMSAVAVTVIAAEDRRAQHVQDQPDDANDDDEKRLVDVLDVDEAFDGLKEDGEAEGEKQGAIEEGAQKGSPVESISEVGVRLAAVVQLA